MLEVKLNMMRAPSFTVIKTETREIVAFADLLDDLKIENPTNESLTICPSVSCIRMYYNEYKLLRSNG